MNVYFDNAATTPMRKEVIQSVSLIMNECFGNPSSTHAFGRTAKTHIETARKGIAKLLNAAPQEIIFTSGGTESDNMILNCAVKDLGVNTLISSPIEHHAILHAIDALKKTFKIKVAYVNIDESGSVDLNHLEKLLQEDDSKKLVSLMHVNNEIGNILDLQKVGDICHNNQALFHTDAVQGIGHFYFDLEQLPVDFLSSAAHKFHGPKGIGFSFVRKNSGLDPFIYGGAQERGLRAGTESVHNIVGMHKALELAYKNLKEEKKEIVSLRSQAMAETEYSSRILLLAKVRQSDLMLTFADALEEESNNLIEWQYENGQIEALLANTKNSPDSIVRRLENTGMFGGITLDIDSARNRLRVSAELINEV